MEASMATRRQVLKVIGGGTILAAAALGGWAATRDPAAARRPWTAAGQDADPVRRALSFAILAPNPHNRQPWLVDLSTPGEITLLADPDRRLPATDPYDRQITLGLGAFLELLAMALAEQGLRADTALFPDGAPQPRLDGRPVARLTVTPDPQAARDPLFAQVLSRRTNRLPYDTGRPVAAGTLDAIAAAAKNGRVAHAVDPDKVAALRDLGWRAMYLEMTTPATARENVELTRIGRAEIEADPDGVALAGPLLEGMERAGLLNRWDLLDPASAGFAQQVPFLRAPFDTAMGFLWQVTPANGRADQIAAGRDYLRLNLAATAAGVAMQPLSQALQEFPEMAALNAEARAALGVAPSETLQMFVRVGYAGQPKPSPRWPAESRIVGA
jgi:hypothetical protein